MIIKLNTVGREGGGEAVNICARLANIVGGRLMIYSHFKIIYVAIEPNWNVSYISHPKTVTANQSYFLQMKWSQSFLESRLYTNNESICTRCLRPLQTTSQGERTQSL